MRNQSVLHLKSNSNFVNEDSLDDWIFMPKSIYSSTNSQSELFTRLCSIKVLIRNEDQNFNRVEISGRELCNLKMN